jgi:hypothetical protein
MKLFESVTFKMTHLMITHVTNLFNNQSMRKGLKRNTYQNLSSLICVEFCPYEESNHRHHDLKDLKDHDLNCRS